MIFFGFLDFSRLLDLFSLIFLDFLDFAEPGSPGTEKISQKNHFSITDFNWTVLQDYWELCIVIETAYKRGLKFCDFHDTFHFDLDFQSPGPGFCRKLLQIVVNCCKIQ